jgi:hypothetical protein
MFLMSRFSDSYLAPHAELLMTIQINGSLVTGTYTNSRRFWEIIF